MEEAARIKCRCPLLGDDDRCLLYQARPITCRLYGVPTAIAGQGYRLQASPPSKRASSTPPSIWTRSRAAWKT